MSVVIDFPALVLAERQIANEGHFTRARSGAAKATEMANIMIEERRAGSPTPLRQPFHVPRADSLPLS